MCIISYMNTESGPLSRQVDKDLNPVFKDKSFRFDIDPERSTGVPLGPGGFNFTHHAPRTRPSGERTAKKAFLLLDRV